MRQAISFDLALVAAALFLAVISLVELSSISSSVGAGNYVSKQLFFAFLGLMALVLTALTDYRLFFKLARPLYYLSLLSLTAVLLFGTQVRGTVGWISVGPFQLQVVEFVKPALIIFLAAFVSAKRVSLSSGVRLAVSFVLTLLLASLVLAQPDFGSAMILFAIWLGMLFVSGIKKTHLIILISLLAVSVTGTWFALADYQKNRILTFLNPELDARGSGYNVIQSMVAVGSGGITGTGLGQGSQTQLRFLPEKHTDFIFAGIAEEMGLVGALTVLLLFAVILFRLWSIARRAPTNFGYLLTAGVMIMIFTQVLINVGMNIGVMPVTGIPLPLVSYGGSSFLATSIALGLALAVDRFTRLRIIDRS